MKIFTTVLVLCWAVIAANAKNMRITNWGETATPGEFPYQVSISANGQHFCGGALISEKHILTAAHCVIELVQTRVPLKLFKVEVGSNQLNGGKKYGVKRISYRKGFVKPTPTRLPAGDIAVITLSSSVEKSDKVKPISLPEPGSQILVDSVATVTGFGSSVMGGPNSQILKKLVTKMAGKDVCQSYYHFQLMQSQICAARSPGYGTCRGDSGGPLVDDTKTTIIGVVSGGTGKCGSGEPDLFTRVSAFIDYIKAEMKGEANDHPFLDESNQKSTLPGFPSEPSQPQYPGTGLPQYPGTGLPQYPGTGLPQYPGTGLPQYPGTGLPQYPGTGLPQYPGTGLPQYPGLNPQQPLLYPGYPVYPGLAVIPGYPGLVPVYPTIPGQQGFVLLPKASRTVWGIHGG